MPVTARLSVQESLSVKSVLKSVCYNTCYKNNK